MGFVSKTFSYTPYKAVGEGNPPKKEKLLEGLNKGRITSIDIDLGHDRSVGFATFDDPLVAKFDANAVFFDPLVLFCLRIDKLTVPSSTLRLHVRSRVAAAMAATNRQRISKKERDEITEQVRGELLRRALPAISAYEVVWNTVSGRVRLYTSSQAVCEDFTTRFKENLGIGLVPMNTVGILQENLPPAEFEKVLHLVSTTFVAVNPSAGAFEVGGPEDDR